jgi:hypothetical protein
MDVTDGVIPAHTGPRQWALTAILAVVSFVVVGYTAGSVAVSGYTSVSREPSRPGEAIFTTLLLAFPVLVGVRMYRRERRQQLPAATLIRDISAALLAIGVGFGVALIFL